MMILGWLKVVYKSGDLVTQLGDYAERVSGAMMMIENYCTGLLRKLFTSILEIHGKLKKLAFENLLVK